MARLLAHEFYHILAQTDDHAPSGIAKARFSTADLLADHFDFETLRSGAIASARDSRKLRRASDGTSAGGR